jgi:hypothetical protein
MELFTRESKIYKFVLIKGHIIRACLRDCIFIFQKTYEPCLTNRGNT